MDRLLARLERKLGRLVPEGLPLWLVGLSGLAYLIAFAKPDAMSLLWFDRNAIAAGEVWRAVTFLFAPVMRVASLIDLLFVVFALQLLYTFMTGLEAQWGSFRFAAFWLIGALGAIAAAFLVGSLNAVYLDVSVLLAFATLFPDYEIVLFFILPVKMRWIGLLSGAGVLWALWSGNAATRAGVVIALANFLLFCGPQLFRSLRGRRAPRARAAFAPEARRSRVCAKCGRSDKDDPALEFRVCDCQERCGGKLTEYCIEHARDH